MADHEARCPISRRPGCPAAGPASRCRDRWSARPAQQVRRNRAMIAPQEPRLYPRPKASPPFCARALRLVEEENPFGDSPTCLGLARAPGLVGRIRSCGFGDPGQVVPTGLPRGPAARRVWSNTAISDPGAEAQTPQVIGPSCPVAVQKRRLAGAVRTDKRPTRSPAQPNGRKVETGSRITCPPESSWEDALGRRSPLPVCCPGPATMSGGCPGGGSGRRVFRPQLGQCPHPGPGSLAPRADATRRPTAPRPLICGPAWWRA